jgi:predicted transcriptional regulator
MSHIDATTILNTLIKHETLTIDDLAKEENLGITATAEEMQPMLNDLAAGGFVYALDNVSPATYTITNKGIAEGTKEL